MLSRFPLIDGHNDLPWELREQYAGDLALADLAGRLPKTHTDIPRLVEGGVGGQFWSVWVPPSMAGAAAALMVLGVIFSAFVTDADAAATMAAVPRAGPADPLAEAA